MHVHLLSIWICGNPKRIWKLSETSHLYTYMTWIMKIIYNSYILIYNIYIDNSSIVFKWVSYATKEISERFDRNTLLSNSLQLSDFTERFLFSLSLLNQFTRTNLMGFIRNQKSLMMAHITYCQEALPSLTKYEKKYVNHLEFFTNCC